MFPNSQVQVAVIRLGVGVLLVVGVAVKVGVADGVVVGEGVFVGVSVDVKVAVGVAVGVGDRVGKCVAVVGELVSVVLIMAPEVASGVLSVCGPSGHRATAITTSRRSAAAIHTINHSERLCFCSGGFVGINLSKRFCAMILSFKYTDCGQSLTVHLWEKCQIMPVASIATKIGCLSQGDESEIKDDRWA
jgi:hypothetical protein